jgi:class I fructose-bisphosphate aldolase
LIYLGWFRRKPQVLVNLQLIFGHRRLSNCGYVSIVPVAQGVEHSAGASFALNPDCFGPENIVELAVEGGCNAVASNFGVLSMVGRKYAHRIPFIVTINHNELLSPQQVQSNPVRNRKGGTRYGGSRSATIYFG